MLNKKWLYLLVAVLLFLIYRGCFYIPKPGFDPEKVKTEAALKGQVVDFDVITNSIGMDFVYIPAGEFMMGSKKGHLNERPVHKIKISNGFYMGVYEVTQGQYLAVMGTNPSIYTGPSIKANNPVEQVSWYDATGFCKKLSQKEGKTYRLPTEAEWEYSCRAGSTTVYSFGDSESDLGDYAWYRGNSSESDRFAYRIPHPVGQKKPNAFGLYDMHGNISEWCSDFYKAGYYSKSPRVDPQGPSSSHYRVLRGGAWFQKPHFCRSADRFWLQPILQLFHNGFRVVLSVSSQE